MFFSALKPISEEKFKDLQHLKRFCGPAAQSYYDNLPHAPKKAKSTNKVKPQAKTTAKAKPKAKKTPN